MKIIKQNDSAGGLIFKQNTIGKAMKQNYNFGKGYNPAVNGSFYRINKIVNEVHPVLTILSVSSRGVADGSESLFMSPYLVTASGFSNYYSSRIETQGRVYDQNSQIGGSIITSNNKLKLILAHRVGAGISNFFRFGVNHGGITETKNSTVPYVSPNKSLPILTFTGSSILASEKMINRLIVFTRILSDVEIDYFINNMLGNDPLNSSDLLFEIRWDKAKIIDNLPCFEDVSGNGYHAELLNLPVGTPQQQVDYVNNNRLFLW